MVAESTPSVGAACPAARPHAGGSASLESARREGPECVETPPSVRARSLRHAPARRATSARSIARSGASRAPARLGHRGRAVTALPAVRLFIDRDAFADYAHTRERLEGDGVMLAENARTLHLAPRRSARS
jgi:hypothetical protein